MAEKLQIEIRANVRQALNALNRTARAVKQPRDALGRFTKTGQVGFLALGRSAKIAGAAIAAAALVIGRKAVRAAVGFGRAMAEVSTITDDTAAENRELVETVKNMAAAMGKDAQETAEALYETISAGVTDSRERLELLNIATDASIAGLTTQEIAVDALTTVMNAYGLSTSEATDVSDILFTTVRLGKIRFAELASGLGRVTSISNAAGVSFVEVGAAIAALTKQGLSSELAMTALRATITAILKPTNQVKTVAKEAGIELGIQATQARGLSGIMEDLTKLYSENNETIIELFPNIRALTGILSLVSDNAREYNDALEQMEERQGTTADAVKKMNASAFRQFEIFKSKLNVTMINLGNVIIPGLITAMKGFEDGLGTVDTALEDNKEALEGVGVALGSIVGTLGTIILKYGEASAAAASFAEKAAKSFFNVEIGGIPLSTILGPDLGETLNIRRRARNVGIIPGGAGDPSIRTRQGGEMEGVTGPRITMFSGPVHIDGRNSQDKVLGSDFWRDKVQGARLA